MTNVLTTVVMFISDFGHAFHQCWRSSDHPLSPFLHLWLLLHFVSGVIGFWFLPCLLWFDGQFWPWSGRWIADKYSWMQCFDTIFMRTNRAEKWKHEMTATSFVSFSFGTPTYFADEVNAEYKWLMIAAIAMLTWQENVYSQVFHDCKHVICFLESICDARWTNLILMAMLCDMSSMLYDMSYILCGVLFAYLGKSWFRCKQYV